MRYLRKIYSGNIDLKDVALFGRPTVENIDGIMAIVELDQEYLLHVFHCSGTED